MNGSSSGLAGAVTCIGTVKVDVVSGLKDHRFDGRGNIYEVAPVTLRAGGTAVNFAAAASNLFQQVNIISAIGDDLFTPLLEAAADAVCTSARLEHIRDQPNAMVLTIRDAPEAGRERCRILVSSDRSPHGHMSESHVRGCESLIAGSDFLVCDCYALQHPRSTSALSDALDLARTALVRTVVDLVPHDLARTMAKDHVATAMTRADLLVAEAVTAVGLREERWPIQFDSEELLLERAVACVRELAPGATWILRYGFENISDTRVVYPDGTWSTYSNAWATGTDHKISGDQLLAAELNSLLTSHRIEPTGRSRSS